MSTAAEKMDERLRQVEQKLAEIKATISERDDGLSDQISSIQDDIEVIKKILMSPEGFIVRLDRVEQTMKNQSLFIKVLGAGFISLLLKLLYTFLTN